MIKYLVRFQVKTPSIKDISENVCRYSLIVMKASKDSVYSMAICKLLQKLNMPRDKNMLTYLVLEAYV